MIKSKWILFAGIILLIAGIVIRKTTDFAIEGLALIFLGVLLKTYYIISMARSGAYKPGYELWFLFVGLTLFLAGLYLKSHEAPFNPIHIIIPGIVLKLVFIVLFIIKTRKSK